jgi:hypothetical protein
MRRIYLDSALTIWLVEQTVRSEIHQFPPPAGSPRFARGTTQGFGSPCVQGEP